MKQFAKLFNVHWNKYMAGQANMVEERDEVDCDPENEDKEFYVDDPDELGFMLIDEVDELNANGLPSSPENTNLIFDSGASKSTLCKYHLLTDPKPVSKSINIYLGSISITHVGKFNLGGTLIYPVYFAPNGP
jgi:hypothetical protein